MDNPLILIDPLPRTLDSICDSETRCRLERLGRLVISEDRAMPAEMVDRHLPETVLLLGQTDMPRERIERAPRLKAIFNVETNFLPNIDYVACRDRGVWVLSPTSAFAEAVAELALGMAIDLARGITAADRAFRASTEKFGLAGNERSFMFTRAPVGIIGFGDLGRKLRALIAPSAIRSPSTIPGCPTILSVPMTARLSTSTISCGRRAWCSCSPASPSKTRVSSASGSSS